MSNDNTKNSRSKKSQNQGTTTPERNDFMSTKLPDLDEVRAEPMTDPIIELRQMFSQLLVATQSQGEQIRNDFLEMKTIQEHQRDEVADLKSSMVQLSTVTSPDASPLKTSSPRKSSLFFGAPDANSRNQIQVLHNDIVYDKELKVSSLEGLQYLSKQFQLLTSKYPGREIKLCHMVAYSLRPHVIAAWNSHCHQESVITGSDPDEVLVEDWFSLSNESVQAILLEAARPRTRELYSRDLIVFLGKGIPQSPPMNTDNFAKKFYVPLMKSLNDLVHLHDLLSGETSKFSTNKAKMPVTSYGTKESPGHIALWLISLGAQKDSMLQWLGKDNLTKFKTLEPAVKFVRARLMEGRSASEARQDFDAKLTPIRYDDILHTQAESYTRFQGPHQGTHYGSQETPKSHHQSQRVGFSALDIHEPSDPFTDPDIHAPSADEYDDEDLDQNLNEAEDTTLLTSTNETFYRSSPTVPLDDSHPDFLDDSLVAITDVKNSRSSIAATFRGYCCELFVFGTCHRRNSGCLFDHSAAGQERCIQSFHLLAKRELSSHAQLPPWTAAKPSAHSNLTNRSQTTLSRPDQRHNYRQEQSTNHSQSPKSHAVLNRHPSAPAYARSYHT
jgi:hypothetical protein